MCDRESRDKTKKCMRQSLVGSNFCLFHKPEKNQDEVKLFRRIINFRNSSEKLVTLTNRQYETNFDPAVSVLRTQELERIHDLNFTDKEKARSDYPEFKQNIIDLYHQSKISGRGNMTLPSLNGFIFPTTDIDYKFNYSYNPYTDCTLFFNECIFEGFMNFSNFTFVGKIKFEDCKFRSGVTFANSIFNDNIEFINSDINTGYSIYGIGMFQNTKFNGRSVIFNNVTGLLEFDSIFSEKTNFQLLNMHYPKEFGTASYGENAYRIAKIQCSRIGNENDAAKYYYLEKCYKGYQILEEPYFWDKDQKGFKKIQFFNYLKRDKTYKKILPKIIDWLFKVTIGYGEKPLNSLLTILLIIFGFAIFYILSKTLRINGDYVKDFYNCLYFSTVTFTTVGYGDIQAVSYGKMAAIVEMFLGVTFIGARTATLLRKLIK